MKEEESIADIVSHHKEPKRHINPGVNSESGIPIKLKLEKSPNKIKFAESHDLA